MCMAQAQTVFAFLFYFLKYSPSLYLNKANKSYRARVRRNPKRKKEVSMCVYTCPCDGQVQHTKQEACLIILHILICMVKINGQISRKHRFQFLESVS